MGGEHGEVGVGALVGLQEGMRDWGCAEAGEGGGGVEVGDCGLLGGGEGGLVMVRIRWGRLGRGGMMNVPRGIFGPRRDGLLVVVVRLWMLR